jgi:uncharacterized membrane protein YdjX (TVP38/TMEM64 family)
MVGCCRHAHRTHVLAAILHRLISIRMKDDLLTIFETHPDSAIAVSLLVNIVVAVLGLIPSVFITAANIIFFGTWKGCLISLAGETSGAIISFFLYRYSFRRASCKSLVNHPKLFKLVNATGVDAFISIVAMRLIPFVPSGLVTFAAAIGKVAPLVFMVASTIGKIPSLAIETYSVLQVTMLNWQGKVILILSAVGLLIWLARKKSDNGIKH